MGRVYWQGSAAEDTGIPEPVAGYDVDRVLRAPVSGVFHARIKLGALAERGETIAVVEDEPLIAPFDGAVRGLLHDDLQVAEGEKVGDLDPRNEISYCYMISDKSLAVGGGVLEALLTRSAIRRLLGA
jgi:xanthine dehydrogenase accessory factor